MKKGHQPTGPRAVPVSSSYSICSRGANEPPLGSLKKTFLRQRELEQVSLA